MLNLAVLDFASNRINAESYIFIHTCSIIQLKSKEVSQLQNPWVAWNFYSFNLLKIISQQEIFNFIFHLAPLYYLMDICLYKMRNRNHFVHDYITIITGILFHFFFGDFCHFSHCGISTTLIVTAGVSITRSGLISITISS